MDRFEQMARALKPTIEKWEEISKTPPEVNQQFTNQDLWEIKKGAEWEIETSYEFDGYYYFLIGIGENEENKELKLNECCVINAMYDIGLISDFKRKKDGYMFPTTHDYSYNGEHIQEEHWTYLDKEFEHLGEDELYLIIGKHLGI